MSDEENQQLDGAETLPLRGRLWLWREAFSHAAEFLEAAMHFIQASKSDRFYSPVAANGCIFAAAVSCCTPRKFAREHPEFIQRNDSKLGREFLDELIDKSFGESGAEKFKAFYKKIEDWRDQGLAHMDGQILNPINNRGFVAGAPRNLKFLNSELQYWMECCRDLKKTVDTLTWELIEQDKTAIEQPPLFEVGTPVQVYLPQTPATSTNHKLPWMPLFFEQP